MLFRGPGLDFFDLGVLVSTAPPAAAETVKTLISLKAFFTLVDMIVIFI